MSASPKNWRDRAYLAMSVIQLSATL
ncbi:hypothetical protein CMUS01_13941, partial [Colletotrichum musicola]